MSPTTHPVEKNAVPNIHTPLVNRLLEIRMRFLGSGGSTLSEDEILQEARSRRGGVEVSISKNMGHSLGDKGQGE